MIDPWKTWREQNQKLWTELATAQFNAITTVSKRMVIILDRSTPRARRRADRESRTMVTEKIRAANRGMIAAAQTAARIDPRDVRDLSDAAAAVTRVGRAFLAPAFRRVARNTERI